MKEDKFRHFEVGFLIAVFMQIIPCNLFVLYGVTITGYFLFEVYQKVFKKGQFDIWDWYWGSLGATIVFLTRYIICWTTS